MYSANYGGERGVERNLYRERLEYTNELYVCYADTALLFVRQILHQTSTKTRKKPLQFILYADEMQGKVLPKMCKVLAKYLNSIAS